MGIIRLLLKRLTCEHDYEFVRNIYGDEINHSGGYRSWWRCKKCGAMALDRDLYVGKHFQEEDK